VDELVADEVGAGERVVGIAEEGVGRVPCSPESSGTINTTLMGTWKASVPN